MPYTKSKNSNVSLEWAAMLIGVTVVSVSAYLIFGTEWNAYRVANVLMAIAFITFITYSYVNSGALKKELRKTTKEVHQRAIENEKLKTTLAELELSIEQANNAIEKLESSLAQRAERIEYLEEQLAPSEASTNKKS
tara:strand:+ start:109 stop:519 length:411 start_codon:yes stop_codon:yes gene_type:complete